MVVAAGIRGLRSLGLQDGSSLSVFSTANRLGESLRISVAVKHANV